MDSNYLGTYAEYLFATECIKRGFKVSFPLLDSSPYDCILDAKGKIFKIQVKASHKEPLGNRNSINIPLNNAKSIYTKDNVDFFAVYSRYYGGFFIFKNKGKMQSIRITKTGKNKIFFNNFDFV